MAASQNANGSGDDASRPPDKRNNPPDQPPSHFPTDYPELEPYTFNGRVVIGIGIVFVVAAVCTAFAMMASQSPQISITSPATFAMFSSFLSANGQQPTKKIDSDLVLVANDFGWNGSTSGPVIRITKGETVRLTVINAGKMAHNFGIAEVPQDTQKLLDSLNGVALPDRLGKVSYQQMSAEPCPGCKVVLPGAHIMRYIMPGEQQAVTFTADSAGSFKYFCMVRGHLWLGMNSDFLVESGKGIVGPSPEIAKENGTRTITTATAPTEGGLTK